MNLEFIKPQNLGSLLMKSSQSNFNLRSSGSYLVRSYLITTVKIHENSELAVSELDVDTPQFGQTLLGIAIEFLPITQFFNLKSKQLD